MDTIIINKFIMLIIKNNWAYELNLNDILALKSTLNSCI